MKKRYFFIFLLILLVFPSFVLSQEINLEEEIKLSEKDTKNVLNSLIQVLTNEWIELTSSADCGIKEQAALITVRRVIRTEIWQYLFFEAPKEVAMDIIKTTFKVVYLIYTGDIKTLIGKIEKMSVDEAKKYATEWLLQNEIKVANGNLTASYESYNGNKQEVVFPYIIVYKPIGEKFGEVGISIYSSQIIKPPIPTWKDPWEGGIDKLPPFIIKINGNIGKGTGDSYRWLSTPNVEVVFDEKVPELDFPKPSFIDEQLASLQKTIKAIELGMEIINDFARDTEKTIEEEATNIWNKIKSLFSSPGSFQAAVGPAIDESLSWEELVPDFGSFGIGQPAETGSLQVSEWEMASMAEQLDDIMEEIDIFSQRISDFAEKEGDEGKKGGKGEEGVEGEKGEEKGEKEEGEEGEESEREKGETREEGEREEGEEGADEESPLEGLTPQGGGTPVTTCGLTDLGSANRNRIIINEVAWAGTETSSTDEWVELKNVSNAKINLAGWQVLDKDGQIKAVFSEGADVGASGFFLLERTDDGSVPWVRADFIYTGNLGNNNEALYLFSPECQLEDRVEALPDWPAGDSSAKKSMERGDDLNPEGIPSGSYGASWYTFNGLARSGVFGTPKAENSNQNVDYYSGGGSAEPPPSQPPAEPAAGTGSPKVLITEVQIKGEKADYDFIELYNPSEQTADLSGWQLKKRSQSGAEYSVRLFPENISLLAKKYLIWANSKEDYHDIVQAEISSTSYLTTNESIVLLNRDKDIIDALAWGSGHLNPFSEAEPFSENPEVNQSLERKKDGDNNYIDTNNNSKDFEIQNCPNPKEQVIECYQEIVPPDQEPGDGEAEGCTDPEAVNYNPEATIDDGTCQYSEPEPPLPPAEPTEKIVINEIGWMGTEASSTDEWLELYNPSEKPVDILNWQLLFYPTGSSEPRIIKFTSFEQDTSSLDGFDYFLMERTNDETISDIPADYIYTRALNDDGGILELRDDQNNLIDKVDCSNGWFAGEKTNRVSMERISAENSGSDPDNWISNNLIVRNGRDAEQNPINGTPKKPNSPAYADKIIYVDKNLVEDDPANHFWNTIQEGVNDSQPNWLVMVKPGNYQENIQIETPNILLRSGAGAETTIIQTIDQSKPILEIKADEIEISGFFIKGNTSYQMAGIYAENMKNLVIKENKFSENYIGLHLAYSTENTVQNNIFEENRWGVYLENSGNNVINQNTVNSKRYSYQAMSCGIYLNSSDNNIIRKNQANDRGMSTLANGHGPSNGICLISSHNNIIENNISQNNKDTGDGIYLKDSSNNIIRDNIISDNAVGLVLSSSNANNLENNRADKNMVGIYLDGSANVLKNNSMADNCIANFGLNYDPALENEIETSNLVQGKKIYYLKNQSGAVIDSSSEAGLIYCFNCQNITIKDLILDGRNDTGIYFYQTSNSLIENVEITESVLAIYLNDSDNNEIKGSHLYKNFRGLNLSASENNKIKGNIFEENDSQGASPCFGTSPRFGLQLSGAINNEVSDNLIKANPSGLELSGYSNANTFFGNTIKDNTYRGVDLYCSSNNVFYHNNFIDNFGNNYGDCIPYPPANQWHNSLLNQGNYYSDYDEAGEGCEDLDSNGICDLPYTFNWENDEYPFLLPDSWK